MIDQARRVWREQAGVPIAFGRDIDVAVAPGSQLCPPGWSGIVVLAGAAIATAPDPATADLVRSACAGLPPSDLTDPSVLHDRLPVTGTLGPATLAYCDRAAFRPAVEPAPASRPGGASQPQHPLLARGAESVHGDAAEVHALIASVSADDAGESGMDEITSPAFVVRDGGRVVAAAGYRTWPAGAAHLSVLTAPGHRGRGLARITASAAVAHALDAGLLPQWRARPEPSRRVALALGFRELGAQLSFSLAP